MKLLQFLLAIGFGWFLAYHSELTLLQRALWVLGASFVLILLTLVVQHATLPPAAQSRSGLTVFQGQIAWLVFDTIATIVVTAVVVTFCATVRMRGGG